MGRESDGDNRAAAALPRGHAGAQTPTLPSFSGTAAPHRETCPPTSCTHTQNHALEIRAPAEQQLAAFSVQHGFGVALLEIFLSDDVGMQVR
ncbi:MAG: hypothetical protein ACPIOQ_28355 [Promethearchaeia archaeon]